MYYIRIVQSKLTDFINIKRNSIGLNPPFFRLFLIFWRKKNLPEVYDYLTPEENAFFSLYIIYIGIYPILVGNFKFDESTLKVFMEKSKRAGGALVKYLNSGKNGKKDLLTPLEKNILYKLKAEDINDIEELIEEKRKYLKAKIECIKLLKILDF